MPLLKTLYSADERNNHHTYMSLIILLILSEDEFFNGMYLVFLHFVIDTVKLCDKERFNKEQIGVKEPFPVTNCKFTTYG